MSIEFSARFREGRALYVLIPLLVLHLGLLSVQIEDPAGTVLFKRWILQAGAPILSLSTTASRGLGHAWKSYIWMHGLHEENMRLQEALRRLSLRDAALSQYEAENRQLRALLAFKQSLPYEAVGARVVGRAPSFLSNVLYIDRGSDDGIRANTPVVLENGVLGRTVLVTRRHSQVQLITNADASLGALVERTRSPGVLSGSGTGMLDLNYISNTEQIEVDDLVVTSGLDGIYPKGLPIGKVVESRKGKSVFRALRVEPFADLLRAEEVLVLLGSTPEMAAPANGKK